MELIRKAPYLNKSLYVQKGNCYCLGKIRVHIGESIFIINLLKLNLEQVVDLVFLFYFTESYLVQRHINGISSIGNICPPNTK